MFQRCQGNLTHTFPLIGEEVMWPKRPMHRGKLPFRGLPVLSTQHCPNFPHFLFFVAFDASQSCRVRGRTPSPQLPSICSRQTPNPTRSPRRNPPRELSREGRLNPVEVLYFFSAHNAPISLLSFSYFWCHSLLLNCG
ncbi:hypothetical protein, unlikely [Trypanosoma congolense IL3000]|uniref:Uncharacterized protein n=1 Tax=Trypanosoma congolense (strain IL3000) TaxID=1068625 RepID=F9W492_TRYCI|nr:hypothetical protein, unlikely [Trypanosoma congolense IL3000]